MSVDEQLSQASENADQYKVKLEMFEGPLDLLLFLIKKEEVSIYDIPIARITEQYLEYLRAMQELDIGVAGEFLVMAATLIQIKSHMLLPRDPTIPEDELEDHPGQAGRGGGNEGIRHRQCCAAAGFQGGAGVEAEPADPQQRRADHGEGDTVGRHGLGAIADALAEHQGADHTRGNTHRYLQ